MNVLHLPHNVGSKITLTVAALRKLGADARGIAINNYLDEAGENVRVFNPKDFSYLNPRKYMEYSRARKCLKESILWADIIHWYYESTILKTDRFVEMVREYKKPAVVEWLGSDIRISDQLSVHNPHYKNSFANNYPYTFETREHSRTVQKKFRDAGFIPLVRPELEEFVQKDIFSSFQSINNRINIGAYPVKYPSQTAKVPVIVHPVTSREAKGTQFILEAVQKLKQKYEFEFLLLEDIQHAEVIRKMESADIVIDQLIIGAFGTTTLEGMALGKPTICYLDDVLLKKLPAGCPIVNTNPDTIYSTLESLLSNPGLRHSTGIQSRQYIETHHDADKVAVQLMRIYEEAIHAQSKK
jgi:glycosyltransferase involved in cell wall biosynthesis